MNFYKLKSRIKNIKLVDSLYAKLIGNRKIARIESAKKNALQSIGLKTLGDIDKTLTDNHFEYFMTSGSLLGIIREGAFMKHDDDIDLCIYMDDDSGWDKLEKILLPIGMKKTRQFFYNGHIQEQTYTKEKLAVDFFLCLNDENSISFYVFFRKDKYIYSSSNESHVSKLNLYKPERVEKIIINNVKFNIPINTEKYLESLYTSNWRIADPNWRFEDIPGWHELEDEIAYVEYF